MHPVYLQAKDKGIRTGDEFLWKDSVDKVRGAAQHAQQLSAFLGLLSKRVLTTAKIAPSISSSKYVSTVIRTCTCCELRLLAL